MYICAPNKPEINVVIKVVFTMHGYGLLSS